MCLDQIETHQVAVEVLLLHHVEVIRLIPFHLLPVVLPVYLLVQAIYLELYCLILKTFKILAGDKFFNSLGGDNANPVFSEALDNIFNPSAPDFGAIRSSITPLADPTIALTSQGPSDFDINYSPGEDVATPDLGTIVGDSATQQALDQLLNRPSLFDDVSGGPIVDRIDELTNQQLDAVSGRLASERADALDAANSNLAAGGLLSSNQVFRAQEEIIGNSLDDFTLQALDFSRDNIKVLSDLALQDAQLGTQSAQAVLQAALEEKGIDANLAAQIAKINADRAISIQTAQIQSKTQLGLGQQDSETKRALGIARLGDQACAWIARFGDQAWSWTARLADQVWTWRAKRRVRTIETSPR